jgi:hypothetical protein
VRPALVRRSGAEPTGPPVHDLVAGATRFGMDFTNATVEGLPSRDDPRLGRMAFRTS